MGILRRDKKEERPAKQAAEPASSDELADRCLDAFASMIRAWAEHPIELPDRTEEEVRQECEEWARHVLLSTPPPGSEHPMSGGARDWQALERSLRKLRQQEHSHVSTSLLELRQIIWVCVQALGKATKSDASSDEKVGERLKTLRSVAQSPDVDVLRREVTSTVSLIESQIEARRARHQSQVEHLSERLQNMTAAFISQKKAGEIDALTQVYTRGAMDDHLADICQMAAVVRPSAIVFLIDVDHFKWVNDNCGHGVGDEMLKRVAARLRQAFRRSSDFVARYGGDEFVAVIEDGSLETAIELGERALFEIREAEVVHEGKPIRVGVSIGVAALKQGETQAQWLERADKALYASKEAGRDRLTVAEKM
jgi:diguanylate cyclase